MDDRMLSAEDCMEMAEAIRSRRQRFTDEPFSTSVAVVLLNFGDRFAHASCVGGEWSGPKHELLPPADERTRRDGLPRCPNGHVLTQGLGKRLRWVDEQLPPGMVPEQDRRRAAVVAALEALEPVEASDARVRAVAALEALRRG